MINKKQEELHEEKFQLERIALFSDAVFAIAITLLIIDIKVPEIKAVSISDKELVDILVDNINNFIAFIISFFVIGLNWMGHHKLFGYVKHFNNKLLFNNLLFLLPIVIMPFSTSFLAHYHNYYGIKTLKLPIAVYMITICLTGFFNFRLWRVIGNPQNKLSNNLNKIILRYNYCRTLVVPIVFIVAFLLSYLNPLITNIIVYAVLPLTPLIIRFINVYFKRKYPAIMEGHVS